MDSGKQKMINQTNIDDIQVLEKQVHQLDLQLIDINEKISIAEKLTEKIKDRNLLRELLKTRCHIKTSIYYRIKMIENIKSQLLIC